MKKIVLIESDKGVRENLAEILQMANYEVLAADNSTEGLNLITNKLPDLIICDFMMPGIDGYSILHIISKNPQLAVIPFIFLSKNDVAEDIRKGLEMGADAFLTKPVQVEQLLRIIEMRFTKNEKLRTLYEANEKDIHNFSSDNNGHALVDLIATENKITYNKGNSIYNVGNRPVNLFYISSGKVKIYKKAEDGSEFIISILKEGDFFGYNALLEGASYSNNAVALEKTELKLIPKNKFLSLMFSDTAIARQFVSLLAENIDEREKQLLQLAYHSLRKRVANTLLYLKEKYNNTTKGKATFKIARKDFADLTGAAKESVTRALSDFKDEHLIEITAGHIILLNEEKLRTMAN